MPTRIARALLALGATLVATTAAVVAIQSPAAAAYAASDLRLTRTSDTYSLIYALDNILPNVSVGDVVNDGNRSATSCTPTMTAAARAQLVASFCWNSDDASNSWVPQGITTSGDSSATDQFDGHTVILVDWYDNDGVAPDKGLRVSFVNYDNPAAPKYRHAVLVEPTGTATTPSFRPVTIHGGGIGWYGNYLYVADTSYGFRVFDLYHIWRVSTGNTGIVGRQSDGTYDAFDYKYVVPQAFRYTQSTTNSAPAVRFSTVSASRAMSPNSLVVAEWGDNANASGKRIIRYNLNSSALLATDSDGLVHADAYYVLNQRDIQGVAYANSKYYLSQDDGWDSYGNLGVFNASTLTLDIGNNNRLVHGVVESLSYWPGKNQLWSMTESSSVSPSRSVFAIRGTAY